MDSGGCPEDRRKLLYKPCSPPWKEAYKQRCREGLRARRTRFLDAVRSGETPGAAGGGARPSVDQVGEVMTEEWERMRRADAALPSAMAILLSEPDGSGGGDEDLEQALSIVEQMQKELREEEEQILNEYWKGAAFSEAQLCEAMQSLETDELCCPLCQKHNMIQNKSVIFCPCGVRVDTEQDCLTMAQIRQHVESAVSAHEYTCSGRHQFSMLSAAGFQNMVLSCDVCDFMQVVI